MDDLPRAYRVEGGQEVPWVSDDEVRVLREIHGDRAAEALSALEKARRLRLDLEGMERRILGDEEPPVLYDGDVGMSAFLTGRPAAQIALDRVRALWAHHIGVADGPRPRRELLFGLLVGAASEHRLIGGQAEDIARGHLEYAVTELGPGYAAALLTPDGIGLFVKAMGVVLDKRGGRGRRKWAHISRLVERVEARPPGEETIKRHWAEWEDAELAANDEFRAAQARLGDDDDT